MNRDHVYWSATSWRDWPIIAAATSAGLCRVTFPNESLSDVASFVHRHVPGATLEENDAWMAPYLSEVMACLSGKPAQESKLPLDLRGTPFQVSVWRALRAVPCGQTVSYSDIAAAIDRPRAVRAVAAAIGDNPVAYLVPCHRVVGKDGSLRGFRGGLDVKQQLLTWEQAMI